EARDQARHGKEPHDPTLPGGRPRRHAVALRSVPPMMRRVVAAAFGLCGCGQLEPNDSGEAEPRVVLLGDVDIEALCDIVGAREVILRATLVGCEQAGPCTLPSESVTRTGDLHS